MTTEELEKLKALAEAVTAGAWWTPETLYDPCDGVSDTDARYIAAANPQTTLALIAEIERLRAQVDELETPKPRHSRGCLCGRCDR